jgi:ABC-type Fe3+-hydroxamate transport system substrate-binding protein
MPPISRASAAPRIASLVPSATELIVALGLGEHLVARTGFCTHPIEALASVPKVGGTKDVNLSKLRGLAPTHVVVNVDENTKDVFDAMAAWGVTRVVTHPQGPADVLNLIDQLAAPFLDLPPVAERAGQLKAELAAALAEPALAETRTVVYLVWRDPWMTVASDTYIARLLAHAGWRTLPCQAGGDSGSARYPTLNADDPIWRQTDEVWLSSEPYAFKALHLQEVQSLAPQAKVRLVDGELCSWWGARTAAGLAYVRSLRD